MPGASALHCVVVGAGAREDTGADLDGAIRRARGHGGAAYVWVDADEPDDTVVRELGARLGLHPLAVEDAAKAHQRAKFEGYGDTALLVVKTVSYDGDSRQIELGEIDVFIGEGFAVTVRHGPSGACETAAARLPADDVLRGHGPDGLAYAIIDAAVDEYEDIVDRVGSDIGDLERRVFSPRRDDVTGAIYFLKREVIEFRDAVEPVPVLLDDLGGGRPLPPKVRPFLRDVADHATRVNTRVAAYSDLLSSALTAHQAKTATAQNSDMRRISAWAAILAVPTLVAGVYGMNFRDMPELGWRFGYPGAVLIMAGLCGLLYWRFRRNGWL